MPYQLTNKLKNLLPYEPINGDYKIRLDANESYINFADSFARRFCSVVSNLDFNRYPDPYAVKLCKAFAEKYAVDPHNVTAGNGSDELISVILMAFLAKGERVLTLTPDFSMYAFYTALSECQLVQLEKKEDLTIDADAVLSALRQSGARLLIFSNPCNPTSLGLSREDVLKIVSGTDALVVVDEAYMDFWNQSILDVTPQYDNLIVLRTCSKAVGAAAIRLGFAVANTTLTTALRAAKSPYNVSALTQAVGEVLLSEKTLVTRSVKDILNLKQALQEALNALAAEKQEIITVYQSNTNFIYLRMKDAKAVYEALLKESIAVRLMGDCLRITTGNAEENKELLKQLHLILK